MTLRMVTPLLTLQRALSYTRVHVYSNGVRVQNLVFPDDDETPDDVDDNQTSDTEAPSAATESSTDEDVDDSSIYNTALKVHPTEMRMMTYHRALELARHRGLLTMTMNYQTRRTHARRF